MTSKLRSSLNCGLLLIAIGNINTALFFLKGIIVIHLFVSLILVTVGTFLVVLTLIKAIVNKQIEKSENQDKLYEKDGWESYGGGLQQYRPRDKI